MRKFPVTNIVKLLVFLGLWIITTGVFGQRNSIPPLDSTKFFGELNTIFSKVPDQEKKLIEPIIKEFREKWDQEKFGVPEKKIIMAISSEMAKKKIRPYPDHSNFINTLNIFINSRQPQASFFTWSEILLKLLSDKNSRKFTAFVESSGYLFGENLLYKSSTTKWKISSATYKFSFDSVPKIEFPLSGLTCYANDDSLNVYKTKGTYYPLANLWLAEGGRVNWKRAGQDPEKVYAELGNYKIQMRFSKFDADSVRFTHQKYFPSHIMGRYTDKVLADVTEDKASYPRFYSYDKMIGIKRLFDQVDFLGGFAMEGNRIIGSGNQLMDARLFFKKDGKDFIIVGSDVFVIRPDRINAGSTSVTIYHEDDSIFHPNLQMKYLDDKKELSFTKDDRMPQISPWYDSYHRVEIYCEALYWKLGEPRVSFQVMKGPTKEGKAVFESGSYYSLPRYEKLQGIDELNPLISIKKFTEKLKSRNFTLSEFTTHLNIPVEQVENLLLNLSIQGYLVYDSESKRVIVKQKLYDYISAFQGKTDYDGIFFNSYVSNTANGFLNLETFDLTIKGVNMVVLSDSQQVRLYPENKEIILKKGLDFTFNGRIEAGQFDYFARECSFEYKPFRLNLPSVDSMFFFVFGKTVDPKTGTYPMVRVKTAITNLSGHLLIDDPGNKSGLKTFPQYPVFSNTNNSFVYWNKSSTQKGVYNKERFYYEVDPFTINGLDDMVTDSLKFTGKLTSAGILPDLNEPLQVRPDHSLGIVKRTDSAGIPVYAGKGILLGKVDLSDRGLRANGTLACLNSKSVSPDYLLLPDSMKTIAKTFDLAEMIDPIELPMVHGDSVWEFWHPYRDSLMIGTTRKQMSMYNDQSGFSGKLALTPALLSGDGMVRIKDAEMDSRGFQFKRRTFDALIANFKIKSYDLADLTISTKNYQTHFDFDQRKGEFKSNIGISTVEFPINKYICSMDRFDWLIDSEEIMLSNERSMIPASDTLNLAELIDLKYTGSEFISVLKSQDSLKFFAAKARYHLRTNIINAEEVKILKVADAAIYPDSGKVTIQKDARMNVLERAIVIANTTSRHHQFYNATLSVASRKKYTGVGDYDYLDRTGKKQKIHFDKIKVDTSGQTVAQGVISDSSEFLLSPEFAFKGAVSLNAGEKNMIFDGGFHPVTTCFSDIPQWVRFESAIDPLRVRIPVKFPLKNTDHEPINFGLMFFNKESRISASFFRPKISFSDTTIITAEGFIEYNLPTNEFRIASPEKLNDVSLAGPYLSLNTYNCKLRGEGKLNLSLNSEFLKLESYGIADYFIIPDSTLVHCALAFNFPFSEAGMQRMNDQLNAINLPGVKISNTPYAMAVGQLTTKEENEKLKNEIELLGKYKKFPEALERTLFLADVHLKWDTMTKSYVSYGNIGIASVGKNQVNRYVNGIIEFSKKRNGDEFSIYLELAKDEWYFYNYRNRNLMARSSDIKFNDLVMEAVQSGKEQNRVVNLAGKGYQVTVAPEKKKRDFLRKFETEETE
jgi:hypothetical protein